MTDKKTETITNKTELARAWPQATVPSFLWIEQTNARYANGQYIYVQAGMQEIDFFPPSWKEISLYNELSDQKIEAGLTFYEIKPSKFSTEKYPRYHRITSKIISSVKGKAEFELEDIFGTSKKVTLELNQGIHIPPFMLYSYKLAPNSSFKVLANIKMPFGEDVRIDEYNKEDWDVLAEKYRQKIAQNKKCYDTRKSES